MKSMSTNLWSRRRWLKSATALGLTAAGATVLRRAANAGEPHPSDAIDIGSRRELFVDHYLIGRLQGVRLKLHEPRPAGAAVKYDGPADERFCFYTTILKDGDTYRMYYRGHPGSDWTKSVMATTTERSNRPLPN
jgi:hypothetical protein